MNPTRCARQSLAPLHYIGGLHEVRCTLGSGAIADVTEGPSWSESEELGLNQTAGHRELWRLLRALFKEADNIDGLID